MPGEASWTERILETDVRFKAVESDRATIFNWHFVFGGCTVSGPSMPTIDKSRKFAEAYIRAIHSVKLPVEKASE